MNRNADLASKVFGQLYESGKQVGDETSHLHEGLMYLSLAVVDLHSRLDKIDTRFDALDNNIRAVQARVT